MTVCISGSHRGGTSLVARVVNLLGVDLGREDQLMAPRPDNPTGFWESGPITALNDDLLDHLGGRWDRPPVLEDGWATSSDFDPWRERARDVLRAAFDEDAPARGWKDPRLSILLPFWRTVTEITHAITVLRSPHDTAASLRARNGMSTEEIEYLWVQYIAAALHTAPHALVVQYDDFLSDLPKAIETLVDFLGIAPPDDAIARIEEFVDPSLRHHRTSASNAEMPLADFVFDAAATGQGPAVARSLHRLTDLRATEVVRLLAHRDELLHERDRAVSLLEDEREERRRAPDRLAIQDEALQRLEHEVRSLGTELQARDQALQEAAAKIAELDRGLGPRWRRRRDRA